MVLLRYMKRNAKSRRRYSSSERSFIILRSTPRPPKRSYPTNEGEYCTSERIGVGGHDGQTASLISRVYQEYFGLNESKITYNDQNRQSDHTSSPANNVSWSKHTTYSDSDDLLCIALKNIHLVSQNQAPSPLDHTNSKSRESKIHCGTYAGESENQRRAIDLGAGSGRDTVALLRNADYIWTVYAVDRLKLAIEATWNRIVHEIDEDAVRRLVSSERIKLVTVDFESEFSVIERHSRLSGSLFDLVNARMSLFCSSVAQFSRLWTNISSLMAVGGVFCGQFVERVSLPGADKLPSTSRPSKTTFGQKLPLINATVTKAADSPSALRYWPSEVCLTLKSVEDMLVGFNVLYLRQELRDDRDCPQNTSDQGASAVANERTRSKQEDEPLPWNIWHIIAAKLQ